MKIIIYSSDLELTIRDCTNSLETNNIIVNIMYLFTNSQETMDCERTLTIVEIITVQFARLFCLDSAAR